MADFERRFIRFLPAEGVMEYVSFEPHISIEEERDLYLVLAGSKPAAIIDFGQMGDSSLEAQEQFENFLNASKSSWVKDDVVEGIATYRIGSSEDNLNMLLGATTPGEVGITLGYPKDAIDVFATESLGVWHTRDSLVAKMQIAKKALCLPVWAAYLTHVPAKFDFVNDFVSSSSKEQAIEYRAVLIKNVPALAKNLEKLDYFNNV